MALPRITRVFGAVNVGTFRISAMIMGVSETGEMIVLGSGHRAAQGIKRGYITDMAAATYAIRVSVRVPFHAGRDGARRASDQWTCPAGSSATSSLPRVATT